MKKKMQMIVLALILPCILFMPALASGVAALGSAAGSVTSFVNSVESMIGYASDFSSALSTRDYYEIATDLNFQQDVETLISSYENLLSSGRIPQLYAETVSFQQSVENLLQQVNTYYRADAASYADMVSDRYFLQDVVNFINSYENLPDSLYISPGTQDAAFSPAYPLRAGIPAVLTMKMATRLGPGTAYSEELGTMPQSTEIKVFEQVTTNGVSWAMVEYKYKGDLYRAYTGMKRVSASEAVPWGNTDPAQAETLGETEAYFGPGYHYAQHEFTVPAHTSLDVYEVENGFLLCDFYLDDQLTRAYLPYDSRIH
jgi:hypothetical protein